MDSTFTARWDDDAVSSLPGVDSGIVADFQKQNRESHSLKYLSATDLSVPVVLVSRRTLQSFLTNGPEPYWSEFYRRYPGSGGSIGFSSIGYNADGDVALLEVDQGRATMAGATSIVVVKRERGRWRVVVMQVTVVS
jgi:hypothetical protein